MMDLHRADPEIPYERFERSARELVAALMMRQDRMNEEIFRRIREHEDIMGNLADRLEGRLVRSSEEQ